MKTRSEFGALYAKYQTTGFKDCDIITTPELRRLSAMCEELDNTMLDVNCDPCAFYFRRIRQGVDSMIHART